ncbi:MAG TPA: MBL fold metallo-hydrolase [Candidatus Brocadiia bacterium]|nr:MBL fold metallo-hydrolase [Candidatus Brocadiia bacterium]
MLTGQALIADIDAARPGQDQVAFWWLGQHSVVLKMGGRVLYIDPYLKPDERRLVKPMLKPEDVKHADFVLCTHDHGDHIDPAAIPGLAAASPGARFVVSRRHLGRLASLGVAEARLAGLDPGGVFEGGGIRITALASKHEFFENDERGWPFLGFVIEAGKAAVYHSGDTLVYDGLAAALKAWRLSVMFLPINGRDAARYRRNCLGNMTYQEAADLAGELAPGWVVPCHYDMFAHNSEDVGKFLDYMSAKFPGQRVWAGRHGERWMG